MKKRILVIDDEEIITSLLQDCLEQMGHEVTVANSGLEGLRRVANVKPDVITLDIKMPGLSGIDVLKRLKDNSMTKDISVILVSAYGDEYRKEALTLGADEVMRKPLDFINFKRRINSVPLDDLETEPLNAVSC